MVPPSPREAARRSVPAVGGPRPRRIAGRDGWSARSGGQPCPDRRSRAALGEEEEKLAPEAVSRQRVRGARLHRRENPPARFPLDREAQAVRVPHRAEGAGGVVERGTRMEESHSRRSTSARPPVGSMSRARRAGAISSAMALIVKSRRARSLERSPETRRGGSAPGRAYVSRPGRATSRRTPVREREHAVPNRRAAAPIRRVSPPAASAKSPARPRRRGRDPRSAGPGGGLGRRRRRARHLRLARSRGRPHVRDRGAQDVAGRRSGGRRESQKTYSTDPSPARAWSLAGQPRRRAITRMESAAFSVASKSPGRTSRSARRSGAGVEPQPVLQAAHETFSSASVRLIRISISRARRSRIPSSGVISCTVSSIAPPASRTIAVVRTGRSAADPAADLLVEAGENARPARLPSCPRASPSASSCLR